VTTVVRRGIAACVAALALAGCSGLGGAGAAATVGGVEISTEFLADQTSAVQEQSGVAPGTPDTELTLGVLQRLIITELVGQSAAELGVTVTQGEIDTARAALEAQVGGPEALVTAYLDALVPAQSIDRQIELTVQVQKIGQKLAPDADPASQQQAVQQHVTGLAVLDGVSVSPRFGTWDIGSFSIGPVPSDLSTPLVAEDPLAGILPAP